MFGWFDQGWYAFSYRVLSGLFNHFIPSLLNSFHRFLQISPQDQHRKCKTVSRLCLGLLMRQNLTEYFVKYELYPHPDTRCPPPSILFRPHEYSLYAPSGHVLSLISPKTTLKYSCNAHCIHTFTHNTCASVYPTMQTNSWHWMSLTKLVKCVNMFQKDLVSLLKHGGSLVAKWWHVYPSMFFLNSVLSMFTGFASKSRINSLFLRCTACWTQQKYIENTV